jgi:hypothetical protein
MTTPTAAERGKAQQIVDTYAVPFMFCEDAERAIALALAEARTAALEKAAILVETDPSGDSQFGVSQVVLAARIRALAKEPT